MVLAESNIEWNWTVLLPVVLGGLAVWYLLPTPRRRAVIFAALAVVVAVLGMGVFICEGLGVAANYNAEAFLFGAFTTLALTFALLTIAQRNPARAAVFFAVVVLNVCGLFLLLAAPFLMAATIIVYAGAIVVTFLFVIMLAQQKRPSDADDRSREPSLAAAVGFLLLGTLLVVLQRVWDQREADQLIVRTGEFAQADALPIDLSNPGLAKQYVADVRRVRKGLGYGTIDIPLDVDGVRRRETHSDPVEDLEAALNLTPPAFEPMSNLPPGIDPQEVRAALKQIHYELQYLKAVRDGKTTPYRVTDQPGEMDGAGDPAIVLSPHGRVKPAARQEDPARMEPRRLPKANVSAIGRALLADHLLAIELGGTLLLVATIGAIAIAGFREKKTA